MAATAAEILLRAMGGGLEKRGMKLSGVTEYTAQHPRVGKILKHGNYRQVGNHQ
jgi:hypothetical protein